MDYVVLSNPGMGVQTSLRKQLEGSGPVQIVRLHQAEDLGASIQHSIEESKGKPVTLIVDACSLPDLAGWAAPLQSVLTTRAIGGNVLPAGSSIVLQLHETLEEFMRLPEVLTNRLKVVDVQKTPDVSKFESVAAWSSSVQEGIRMKMSALATDIVYGQLEGKIKASANEISTERASSQDTPSI